MRLMPKSAQREMFGDVLADIEQDVATSLETGTSCNGRDACLRFGGRQEAATLKETEQAALGAQLTLPGAGALQGIR